MGQNNSSHSKQTLLNTTQGSPESKQREHGSLYATTDDSVNLSRAQDSLIVNGDSVGAKGQQEVNQSTSANASKVGHSKKDSAAQVSVYSKPLSLHEMLKAEASILCRASKVIIDLIFVSSMLHQHQFTRRVAKNAKR